MCRIAHVFIRPCVLQCLQCGAVSCSELQCGALRTYSYAHVCYSVLQCGAVCCSVLQCVAVCCIAHIFRHHESRETGIWEERGGGGKEREYQRVGGEEGPGRTAGKTDEGGSVCFFLWSVGMPKANLVVECCTCCAFMRSSIVCTLCSRLWGGYD